MSSILDKLSDRCWEILFVGLAIAIASCPIALMLLATQGGGLEYKTADRTIYLKGKTKELTIDNNLKLQKLETQLQTLNESNRALLEAAKRKKVDRVLRPEIDKVEADITESKNKFKEVEASAAQLNEFVEDAINE